MNDDLNDSIEVLKKHWRELKSISVYFIRDGLPFTLMIAMLLVCIVGAMVLFRYV